MHDEGLPTDGAGGIGIARSVRMQVEDGSWVTVLLRLRRQTLEHEGPEHVADLLNHPDPLFSAQLPDGSQRFYCKGAIVRVELKRDAADAPAAQEVQLYERLHRYPVQMSLVSGEAFSGQLALYRPEGETEPLVDSINRLGPFLTVLTRDTVLFVARRHLTWLAPL